MEVENYEQYDGVECEIIDDKTILDQNHLYKIILIGSSGINFVLFQENNTLLLSWSLKTKSKHY
jgi:hypothetical protein